MSNYLSSLLPELCRVVVSYLDPPSKVMLYHTSSHFRGLVTELPKKNELCSLSARYGYLNVLEWSRKNNCEWGYNTPSNASLGGHLEVLIWCVENGCVAYHCFCYEEAAKGGHVNIIEWLYSKRYWLGLDVWKSAARHGRINVLELLYVYRKNDPYEKRISNWHSALYESAAEGGHIEVLDWLDERGLDGILQANAGASAAANGHLNVLLWIKSKGYSMSTDICSYAAKGGHLSILIWLVENGCVFDSFTFTMAAQNGHLEIVKWLRENGCPWDESVCCDAVYGGHLNVLIWLRENGHQWNKAECLIIAKELDNREMIRWIESM